MQSSEVAGRVCRVLLIEDDDVDFTVFQRALARSVIPLDCQRARRLADVRALVAAEKFDIVITDLNLPDSSGLDTLSSLLNLVDKTPIVVLSGAEDDAIALETITAGAQDFIPKRCTADTDLVNRTLQNAIGRYRFNLNLKSKRDSEQFSENYDQCTSLPNRFLFSDRVHQAVALAQRKQEKFALLLVDLDRFKNVNDALGHSAGDEVLRSVAKRMQAIVRDSDTVARLGGDEFVIILQLNSNHEAIKNIADKIIESINEPIQYGDHTCSVGASIGISCYPRHGHAPEFLLKNADMAMYEAKAKGRNQAEFFNHELFEEKNLFFSLEKALRGALRNIEANFSLHYQPRVELTTGDVVSVEALIRWEHPEIGNISPEQFIPLAEDLGLIEKIDTWVLEKACEKIAEWQDHGEDVPISVNISGSTFSRKNFVDGVVEPILKKYNVDGSSLEMEITEGVLLSDNKRLIEKLTALKGLGISLAIDDFGTGLSSLNYLNHFLIDILKIDGSFICDRDSSEGEKALLKAIVSMGSALHMNVVAENVETAAQHQYLLSLGCRQGQGFYWSRPDASWTPMNNQTQSAASIAYHITALPNER